MKISDLKRAYFIGIGGIGMSAIARYFNFLGIEIFGYDKTETKLTKKLVSEGMKIHYEPDTQGFPEKIDVVVFTPAIPDDFPELAYVRNQGFPVYKRSEMLGLISKDKHTIAIAGTHGKTTCSAMVSHILKFAGREITAFVGGIMSNYNSNFFPGKSDTIVLEADEYDRSFLRLNPDIAAIISVDPDHLDIYENHQNMLKSGFGAFIERIRQNGVLVTNAGVKSTFDSDDFEYYSRNLNTITCGPDQSCYAEQVEYYNGWSKFDFTGMTQQFHVEMPLMGEHNISNAVIAITIALLEDVTPNQICESLKVFSGIKRRFEVVYKGREVTFIDDYAHHPTELRSAIGALKKWYPGNKILGVFQPHLYSRTEDFADDFATELNQLDEVILLPIYPARELPIHGVSSAMIEDQMDREKVVLVEKKDLLKQINERTFDVIVTLGAGDIDQLVDPIKEYLIRNEKNKH